MKKVHNSRKFQEIHSAEFCKTTIFPAAAQKGEPAHARGRALFPKDFGHFRSDKRLSEDFCKTLKVQGLRVLALRQGPRGVV